MAYAQLDAVLTLRLDQFQTSLDKAETLMRGFVGADWKVPLRLDMGTIGSDLTKLKTALTSLGKLNVPVELSMKVNGQAVVIEQMKAATTQVKKMGAEVEGAATKAETVLRRMMRSGSAFQGSGAGALQNLNSTQLVDVVAYREQWKKLRGEAAKAGIDIKKAMEAAGHNERIGSLGAINFEEWHKLQTEVRGVIAAEKEVKAQQKATFDAWVGENERANAEAKKLSAALEKVTLQNAVGSIKEVGAVLAEAEAKAKQLDAAASKAAAALQRMKQSGSAFHESGAVPLQGLSESQLGEVSKFRAQYKKLRDEAAKAGVEAKVAFEKAFGEAKGQGRMGTLGAVDWEGWHKVQEELRGVIGSQKEAVVLQKEAVALQKQLNEVVAQIEAKGGRAFLPLIQGAGNLDKQLEIAKAKLLEVEVAAAKLAKEDAELLKRAGKVGVAIPDHVAIDRDDLKQAVADLERYKALEKQTAQEAKEIGKAMAQNAKETMGALRQIDATFDKVDKGARKAEADVQKLGHEGRKTNTWLSQIGNTISRWAIGYTVVSTLISGVEMMGHALFAYNAIIQRTTVSLTAMFHGNRKEAEDLLLTLQKFAVTTPIQFETLLPLVPQLTAAKIAVKDLIPTIRALGDAAAVSGKPIGETVATLATDLVSLSARGRLTYEQIRAFSHAGVDVVKYLAEAYGGILPKGIDKARLAMGEMIHKGLIPAAQAIKAITLGIENDPLKAGQMAKMSRTWITALTNLKDAFNQIVGGAFQGTFNQLSDKVVDLSAALIKLANNTKFKLDVADKVLEVKNAVLALYNAGVRAYGLLDKFNLLLPVTVGLLAIFARTNPFALVVLALAALVARTKDVLENWDKMNIAVKAVNVVLGVFVGLLAVAQLQAFGAAMVTATGATSTFNAALKLLNVNLGLKGLATAAGDLKVLGGMFIPAIAEAEGFAAKSKLVGEALTTPIAGISSLALFALPVLVAAIGLAAIAWENYKARQDEADVANNNLAIAIDATRKSLGELKDALSQSPTSTKAIDDLSAKFEKVKDDAAGLQRFIGSISSKKFEMDLRFKYKNDPVSLYEEMRARAQIIAHAKPLLEELIIKEEVKNDPYGWAKMRQNFDDAKVNHDNFVWAAIDDWDKFGTAIDNFTHNASQWLANFLHNSLGPIGDKLQDILNLWRITQHLTPVAFKPDAVSTGAPNTFNNGEPDPLGDPADQIARIKAGAGILRASDASADPYGDAGLQKIRAAADKWVKSVAEIDKMSVGQLKALRASWNAEMTNDPNFLGKHSLDAADKELATRLKAHKDDVGALNFGKNDLNPEKPGKHHLTDAEKAAIKAAKAAKKLENSQLGDAAQMWDAKAALAKKSYEEQAHAAEESAKRQIAALKSLNDKFANVFGGFQEALAKYGIFNSPLTAMLQQMEAMLGIPEKMRDKAIGALTDIAALNSKSKAEQAVDLGHAKEERQKQDSLNGRATDESKRTVKIAHLSAGAVDTSVMPASTILPAPHVDAAVSAKQLSEAAILKLAEGIPQVSIPACANFAGALLNRMNVAIPSTNIARDLAQNASRMARRIPLSEAGAGDLIVYRGPNDGSMKFMENGRKVGYHVMVGLGNGRAVARNHSYLGPIRAPKAGEEGFAYATGQGAGIGVGGNQTQLAARLAKAGGVSKVAGLGEDSGKSLVESTLEAFKSLTELKLTTPPKEFGAPIKEAEGHAMRFKVQMMLANAALQAALKTGYPGSKLAAFMAKLGEATDYVDNTLTRQGAMAEVFKMKREDDVRGKENDPFALMKYAERPGGPLEHMRPKQSLWKAAHDADTRASALAPGGVIEATNLRAYVEALKAAKAAHKAFYDDGAVERNYYEGLRSHAGSEVTQQLKVFTASIKDRNTVIAAGRPFIQGATYDIYQFTRATQLMTEKVAFRNTPTMIAEFNTAKKQYKADLAEFSTKNAAAYDAGKDNESNISLGKINNDLKDRLILLRAQAKLSANAALSEGDLTIALESQLYYFEQLKRLHDEHKTNDEARVLAAQLTAQENYNKSIERGIVAGKAMVALFKEAAREDALSLQNRATYATTRGGTEAQDRALFFNQTRSDLKKQYEDGKFDANPDDMGYTGPRGSYDKSRKMTALEEEAMRKYDRDHADARIKGDSVKLATLQNDLELKGLELAHALSEVEKEQLGWKQSRIVFTEKELNQHKEILKVLSQIDAMKVADWQKEENRQSQLNGAFDPNKRADLQFRFDKADKGWSDKQINELLPVDRMLRKQKELFDGMNSLFGDWKSSWQGLWRDAAQKGQFSLGSMLDNMTNRLVQWGADMISNEAWKMLTSLLTSFATGILGSPQAAGSSSSAASQNAVNYPDVVAGPPVDVTQGQAYDLPSANYVPSFAKGLDYVPHDGFIAELHRGETVLTAAQADKYRTRNVTREVALSGARAAGNAGGGNGGSSGGGDLHFYGPVDLSGIRHERDIPSAAQQLAQGRTRDSRRTVAKKGQQLIGVGQ